MKIDLSMPQMGESITEGTIAKWLKKPGDSVERDEAVLEITTDKIDSEIPSPEDGVLSEILVEEGETVEVGTVLARIETDRETAEAQPEAKEKKGEKEARKAEPATRAGEEKPEAEEEPEEEKLPVTPVAKKIASEKGVSDQELKSLSGSGQGGRITKQDILEYLEQRKLTESAQERPKTTPQRAEQKAPAVKTPEMESRYDRDRVEIIEMSPMRRRIAEHMVYSKHTSPHTYTVAEVDLTRIVNYREQMKKQFEKEEGFKLTYNPFILQATVQALKAFPLVNASLEEDRIIRKEYIHLGVAVAVEEGLLVPVIRDADEKNLLGLARNAWELALKAREKRLKPDDLQGGTFTVTNPGVFGNIFGLPIINQPQLGILGVGAVTKRPVVIQEAIAIRSIVYLSFSYDHRVIDGAMASRFTQEIRANLEEYDVERAL